MAVRPFGLARQHCQRAAGTGQAVCCAHIFARPCSPCRMATRAAYEPQRPKAPLLHSLTLPIAASLTTTYPLHDSQLRTPADGNLARPHACAHRASPASNAHRSTWRAIGKSNACEKICQPCPILVHINAKTLEEVLGKIQSDRANLRWTASSFVIRLRRSL
jgi:hypothetical protein